MEELTALLNAIDDSYYDFCFSNDKLCSEKTNKTKIIS